MTTEPEAKNMPEPKTGLPGDEELREIALDAAHPGSSDQIEKALREVRDRTLRWAADQCEPIRQTAASTIQRRLREAAGEAERG